jgi:hypothetical protein
VASDIDIKHRQRKKAESANGKNEIGLFWTGHGSSPVAIEDRDELCAIKPDFL